MFKPRNPYFSVLIEFLARFENPSDGKYILDKHSRFSLTASGLRDLLLETGVLVSTKVVFEISSDVVGKIEAYFKKQHIFTPRMLARRQAENKAIGEKAEELVLELEKERLREYPHLLPHIERISLIDVSAGYDIRSFYVGLDSATEPQEIGIEVKAVSAQDRKFFWTRNEIQIAGKMGQKYFLYLVPVAEGNFNMGDVMILRNPYTTVFKSRKEWKREVEITRFWKKD